MEEPVLSKIEIDKFEENSIIEHRARFASLHSVERNDDSACSYYSLQLVMSQL